MATLRNRRVFGRPLAGTLAFVIFGFGGLLALGETGRGTVLSAGADTSAPEFAYSGDNGPGFWGETSGWEAARARPVRSDSRRLTSTTLLSIGTSARCSCVSMRRRWLLRITVTPSKRSTNRAVR